MQIVIRSLMCCFFQVHYDIVGKGDSSRFFEINPDSGELRVKDDFRKEPNNEYEVGRSVERTINHIIYFFWLIPCFYENTWRHKHVKQPFLSHYLKFQPMANYIDIDCNWWQTLTCAVTNHIKTFTARYL